MISARLFRSSRSCWTTNEGVVGPDGAFWVGTMRNNLAPDGSPLDTDAVTGRLYRCRPDSGLEELSEDGFDATNTFVWTRGGRLVTADTAANNHIQLRSGTAGR